MHPVSWHMQLYSWCWRLGLPQSFPPLIYRSSQSWAWLSLWCAIKTCTDQWLDLSSSRLQTSWELLSWPIKPIVHRWFFPLSLPNRFCRVAKAVLEWGKLFHQQYRLHQCWQAWLQYFCIFRAHSYSFVPHGFCYWVYSRIFCPNRQTLVLTFQWLSKELFHL